MDNTFKRHLKWLKKPITSVVVILSMFGTLSSVSQTYALGTNEDFQTNLVQDYQKSSKLSDFIQKFISYFSEENKVNQNSESISYTNSTNSTDNPCGKDLWLTFLDIQNSEYKDYIITLYNKWVVIWSSNKFSPDDHLHFYCMIKILVDSYRSKMWYDLKTELWLSQRNYFFNVWKDIDKISLKYLNTAHELWFLEWIDDINLSSKAYFKKNTTKYIVRKLLDNIKKQFPLLVNIQAVDQIWDNQEIITRWEYTKHIVNLFEFQLESDSNNCEESWKTTFSDYMNHDYEEDIQVLADLWITSSQWYEFHSNNYLRYYEFIIMLTRTILYKENQELNIYVLDHIEKFDDIDSEASYARYFEYAYHNGFLNYWFDSVTGKPSVHPNRFIKIDEINNIFSKLVSKKINFQVKSTNWLVTRWEFADMLVDWFKLEENQDINAELNNVSQSPSLLNEIWWRLKSAKLLSKI